MRSHNTAYRSLKELAVLSRNHTASILRMGTRLCRSFSALIPILLFCLLAPVSAQAYLEWSDGSSYKKFGPNASITIGWGQIQYMCDFIYPAADVYIVPSGSASIGSKLHDVAGTPNTVMGVTGGLFIDETIGYAAPSGRIWPGKYAVVYDECQDGEIGPEDFVLDPAFEVVFPPTEVPSINPAIQRIKADAAVKKQQALEQLIAGYEFFAVAELMQKLEGKFDPAKKLYYSFMKGLSFSVNPVKVAKKALADNVGHWAGIAADPPDPNFSQFTPLDPREQIILPSNDLLMLAFTEGVGNTTQTEAALAKAFLASLERYQGADAAGDGKWALIHAKAIRDYSSALVVQIGKSNTALAAFIAELDADARDLDGMAATAEALRVRLRDSGLTDDEIRVMRNLGYNDAEIAEQVSQYVAQDLSGFSKAALKDTIQTMIEVNNNTILGLQTDLPLINTIIANLEADASVVKMSPTANAGGPYLTAEGVPLELNGSASSDPKGFIAKWEWDLDGDGEFDDATGVNPSAVFTFEFIGLIGLQVTNDLGEKGIAYAEIVVTNVNDPPVIATFAPEAQQELTLGHTITFNIGASDPDNDPISIQWLLDGTPVGTGGTMIYAPANLNEAGSHVLRAVVSDNSLLGGSVETNWEIAVFAVDSDGDGWNENTDCDPGNSSVSPGAPEMPNNGIDDDCNPVTPDVIEDADGDGFFNTIDCDDHNILVNPDALEICNGIDDNCNNQIDEGVTITFYADVDGDTYGDLSATDQACTAPVGYVADNMDCNDNDFNVHPNAAEICNGADDNCNTLIDEGVLLTFYRDADGDTYGDMAVSTQACAASTGYVSSNADCNDSMAAVNPGAIEILYNSIDDDCNPITPDGIDADNDLYADNVDCNDSDPTVNPGRKETAYNGKDDDCNAATPDDYAATFMLGTDDSGYVYYAHSNGDGTWSNSQQIAGLSGLIRGSAIFDADNDGDLDFMIPANPAGSTLSMHLFVNDGSENFTSIGAVGSSSIGSGKAYGMTSGDFNEDGNADFLISRDGTYIIFGFGDGKLGFTISEFNTGVGNGRGVDTADFNHDGHPDFVRAAYSSGQITLYLGKGDGTFTSAGVVADSGIDPYGLSATDFNNDGHPDFLAIEGSGGLAYFYAGKGNGTFAAGVAVPSIDTNNHGSYGNYDFNRDGNQDLLISGYSTRKFYYYPGNGDGTFQAQVVINPTNTTGNNLGVNAPPGPPPAGDPIASVFPDYVEDVKGATKTFTGAYSKDDDSIVSYDWNFGDGTTASGVDVTHQFPNIEGTYSVRLTITDTDGRKSIAPATVRLAGAPPEANTGGPYVVGENTASNQIYSAVLNGSSSTDDVGIVRYQWDFGTLLSDTFTGTTLDALKWIYPASGVAQNEVVTLSGDNSWGNRYLFSNAAYLRDEGLTFEATVLPENPSGNQYAMAGFKDTSSNNSYTQLPHALYFYNGEIRIYEDGSNRGTAGSYTRGIPYEIKIVLKSAGARYFMKKAGDPLWTLLYDSNYSSTALLKPGITVNSGTIKLDNANLYLVLEGVNPVKKLQQGIQSAILRVTDSVGQQSSAATTITAVPGAPPVSIPGGPYTFGETVASQNVWTVTLNGAGSTDDVAVEQYNWSFGDGQTGTGVNPKHQYTGASTFPVSLTVVDRAGQSHTAVTMVTTTGNAPPVSNPGGPYTVPEAQVINKHWTISVNASSSTDDVGIWKYAWDFGDGSTATTSTATHTYAAPGIYTISLTVTDHASQTHTATTTAFITGTESPVANGNGPYFAEPNLTVEFNGAASSDDTGILKYEWDFGDGTTGIGIHPSHTYTAPGTYTVRLKVADFALQESVYTTTVTVAIGNPPAANPGGPYQTKTDLPIRFNGSGSTDDNGIVKYLWKVGSSVALLADNFDGTILDSTKWLYPATGVTQNEAVTLTGGTTWASRYLFSKNNFAVDASTQIQGQVRAAADSNLMFGFKNTSTSNSYNAMPYALYFNSGNLLIYESGSSRGTVGSYSINTLYDVKIAFKGNTAGISAETATGARYYYKESTSTEWILLYDSNYVPTDMSMKVGVSYNKGTFVVDTILLSRGIFEFSGERPVIFMNNAGSFPVQLTVTDGANQSHTASTTLAVVDEPAVITVPWQFSGGIEVPHDTWSGEEVILKAVVKSKHEPLTYTWEFGDGESVSGTTTNKYDVSARHTYTAAPGTPFVAKLTVTDADGKTASDIFPVIMRDKTLDVEVNKAIDDALWYLHTTQDRTSSTLNGSWHSSNYTNSYFSSQTASSVHSMEINGHLEAGDFSNDPYVEDAYRGMIYLLTRGLRKAAINDQPYGNPDINGNGIGIEVTDDQPIYQGGMVMMALVASGTPGMKAEVGGDGIQGRTYQEIVEDMAEMYYWGQEDISTSGGWRYRWNEDADNSACQWAALGLDAAEEQLWITIPQWVKDRNIVWLDASRQSNGIGYGYSGAGSGVVTSPSGLAQAALDGILTTDDRWKKTENYIAQNWNSWFNPSSGSQNGNYYAYYALAKAMRIAKPNEKISIGEGTAYAVDWYNDPAIGVARTIVGQQDANGQFAGGKGDQRVTGAFKTAWGIIILTKTLFVLPPVADAGDNKVWGIDWPLTFNGSKSYHLDPFRQIVSYEWDFDGDGTFDTAPSSDPTATHTYTELGTYTVTLRVKDNNDPAKYDTDTITIVVAVPPHPPVSVPGGPYTGTTGIPVQLDGTGSYDIDPTDVISFYGWELDGAYPYDFDEASGGKPAFVFNTPGMFNIGLRVLDNGVLNDKNTNGQVDEDEKLEDVKWTTIIITANHTPIAEAGGPYTVNEGSSTTLNGSGSSDPDNNPITYTWDLDNDGEYDDSTAINPSFSWLNNGEYTVGLKVSDGALSSTDTASIKVTNGAPLVNAGPDQTVNEGATVKFSGSFTDPGSQDTHTIAWNFGDGGTSSGTLTPTHAYPQNGTYTVTLTVTDSDGASGTDTMVVKVANGAPLVNAGPDQTVNEGATVKFSGSFTDPGSQDTHTIAWNFGDGGTSSGTLTPTHAYPQNGTYTVMLTVTDSDGVSGTDTMVVKVANGAPVVNAGPDQVVNQGQPVSFNGSFTDPGVMDTHSISWDFGDGKIENGTLTPVHAYANSGVFTVMLKVTDDDGDTGSDTLVVAVNTVIINQPPVVNAGSDQTITLPNGTTLSGSVTDDGLPNGQLDLTWTVISGPGSVTFAYPNAASTTAGFSTAGTYVLRLTASDAELSRYDEVQITVNPELKQTIFDLTARAKDSKIDIVWMKVADAVTYNIYRSTQAGGPYARIKTGQVTTYCTYADFGLTNGVTYYYRVTSVDSFGTESLYSNEAGAMPKKR